MRANEYEIERNRERETEREIKSQMQRKGLGNMGVNDRN